MTGILPYFPRISFFQRAVQEGKILVFPELIYDKNWQINRMIVPGSNGLINLSIPISGGRNCKVRLDQVEIDNRYHWQRDHFRTLSSVYGRSPFFNYFADELGSIMERHFVNLLECNTVCFSWVFKKLNIERYIQVLYNNFDGIVSHNNQLSIKVDPLRFPKYSQVFEEKTGFQPDVSILDLLFNLGPNEARKIIVLESKPIA